MDEPATPKRPAALRRTDSKPAAPRPIGRGRGFTPVATLAARITAPILKKHGLAEARILTEWATIAGDAIAARSAPDRLTRSRGDTGGGTLRLRISGAWALEFQHLAPDLIQRINAYFGYPAVARITFVQAPLPARRPPAAATPLPAATAARLAAATAVIDDPELRERLLALGRALERRETAAGSKSGNRRIIAKN